MSSVREFQLFLMVYFGDPEDRHWTRHIALFFQGPDKASHITYHVKKYHTGWMLDVLTDYDAMKSINIVGKVNLAHVSIQLDDLRRVMESVPIIKNIGHDVEDDDSSCQTWTGKALEALCAAGYISSDVVKRGIDGMIGILDEAP